MGDARLSRLAKGIKDRTMTHSNRLVLSYSTQNEIDKVGNITHYYSCLSKIAHYEQYEMEKTADIERVWEHGDVEVAQSMGVTFRWLSNSQFTAHLHHCARPLEFGSSVVRVGSSN